ncbi:FAD-dependent monooxygenase [Mycolicibacterium sp. 120266]|uniref:FAD-dependent monooxygenase n=1 Tax=Mycolicibacterium sp. 120266 TaxID=3090601 RepID=UPI00299E09EA|nr:FAD-dependent monooxygenase [Mycolicibacterium sp. 120266]MDX1872078.1 FAD-dependent monooxygenase [Mycolicibacterium sp. 120266]
MTVTVASQAIYEIDSDEYDVVVVGAGPVGLAAAIDLGTRSVRVLVVDSSDGSITYPTAESIDVRTMEWLRQHQLSGEVERSGFPADHPRDIAFVTRLTAHEVARFPRPSNADRLLSLSGTSPEGGAWWPKFWFDTALRNRANALPSVTVRYGWRCLRTAEDSDGVVAFLQRSRDVSKRVMASYIVACDGAGSTIRRQLGVALEGVPAEATWQGVFADIPDLLAITDARPAVQYYALRPRRAIFGSLNGDNLWRVTYPLRPGERHGVGDVVATIRDCIGSVDIEVNVVDSRTWSGRTVVASAYRVGRVLLAGDAAHQMWPSGGHGMNTGIGDVHNLCWKLDMVLRGQAGPELLDSYHLERKPVAERNARRAQANYLADIALPTVANLDDDGKDGDTARARAADAVMRTRAVEWSSLGTQLGYRYTGSPVVIGADTSEAPDGHSTYVPAGMPGRRAPHVELPDGSSVLDLFGRSFVLLVSPDGPDVDDWIASFADSGAPLDVIHLRGSDASASYPMPLTLVRPDGFIAWAGSSSEDAGALTAVVLCRTVVR